ncbi:MAG TPA: hypothetical protein VFF58_00275 [Candidatus Nitrosotalea sp.]|nr:hypothetical protein [Candidatus Nitrosotalea sp.]
MKSKWLAMVLAPTLIFLGAAAGHAQTWAGGPGNWSNPADWCGGLPNGGNVLIGACQFSLPSTVTEDVSATIGNLTIDSSSNSLTVAYPTRLTINGSSISNAGTLAMAGGSSPSQGAQMQLAGGGTVTLSGSGIFLLNDSQNVVLGGNTDTTLVNQQTIRGAGIFGGEGLFNMNNQGLVDAQGTNPLNFETDFGTMVNTGTLQASAGGTMILTLNGTPPSLNNAGGIIKALDGSMVRLQEGTITGGTLTTTGSGMIEGHGGGLTNLANSGLFRVGGVSGVGSAVIHLTGAIVNSGTIRMGTAAWGDDITVVDGTLTLTGGGTVNFANVIESMVGGTGTPTIINTDNTISGTGVIGGGSAMTLSNSGTVDANASTALTINVPTTNPSHMQASNGGTLVLMGAVDNTGGTIEALTGSTVTLSTPVKNGLLTTAGTGIIQSSQFDPKLDSVTNSGSLVVPNDTFLTLVNTITNTGTIFESSTGGPTQINISGPVTLTGGGKVVLSNSANNIIVGASSAASLINVDNLIEGSGAVPYGGLNSFVNEAKGTLYASQAVPLLVGGGSGVFTNLGTLQVKKGSTMQIQNPSFTNFSGTTLTGGTYNVAGTLEFPGANIVTNAANILLTSSMAKILNSNNNANALANFASNATGSSFSMLGRATLTIPSSFNNAGNLTVAKGSKITAGGAFTQTAGITRVDGTLAAPAFALSGGTVEGNSGATTGVIAPVTSSGTVIVGDSKALTGILSMSAFTQSSTGNLNIQIKTSPGSTCAGAGTNYSQLVSGGVALDGTLTINLLRHPALHSGDCFDIVQATSRSGQFATVKVVGGTQSFNVNYSSTGVQLVVP